MTKAKLKDTLRLIVRQYGFEQVDQSLREIRLADRQLKSSKQSKVLSDKKSVTKPLNKRAKVNAPEYVAKMELSSKKKPIATELAKRFENKAFLPTFGDIRNFCQIYGIDEPASKSRVSAIPRVFKFIATMKTDEIQRILDDGMFSGPSRLGPIADAIRRNGRNTRSYTSANSHSSSSSTHKAPGDLT